MKTMQKMLCVIALMVISMFVDKSATAAEQESKYLCFKQSHSTSQQEVLPIYADTADDEFDNEIKALSKKLLANTKHIGAGNNYSTVISFFPLGKSPFLLFQFHEKASRQVYYCSLLV